MLQNIIIISIYHDTSKSNQAVLSPFRTLSSSLTKLSPPSFPAAFMMSLSLSPDLLLTWPLALTGFP